MDIRKRNIQTTSLRTVKGKLPDITPVEFDVLKSVYAEANQQFRLLTDIRFKLLGLLPAISVISWAELYDKTYGNAISGLMLGTAISIFGLIISYGVWVYDQRNNELYNDVISRCRKIEEELGVNIALYLGRLAPNKKDPFELEINHGRAINLIYAGVFIGWFTLIVLYIAKIYSLKTGLTHTMIMHR